MAISLSKGGNVNLTKEVSNASGVLLTAILVGLGWDARATDGQDFDLDASAFLLTAEGKVRSEGDFCFYNQPSVAGGAVISSGDNKIGDIQGDDETLKINLSDIPAEIEKIVFVVSIHEAEVRKQNFGQVSNAFIRVVNQGDNSEISRFDLSEDVSVETSMIFGELYRSNGDWKFKAVGQGSSGGLSALALTYGVTI